MDVVHEDTIKLDSAGRINLKRERGVFVKKTHPNVAVDDEADAKQAIEKWRRRARGNEGGGGEWDEARGEQTLECPVVRPVRLLRRREGRRIVHSALVDR
jgi:hypothetical protein